MPLKAISERPVIAKRLAKLLAYMQMRHGNSSIADDLGRGHSSVLSFERELGLIKTLGGDQSLCVGGGF
jgi:hypothetical protein